MKTAENESNNLHTSSTITTITSSNSLGGGWGLFGGSLGLFELKNP